MTSKTPRHQRTRRGNPKGDPTRRARWLEAVGAARKARQISRGAMCWATALSLRSNGAAKPVWGLQTGQAADLGVTDRTIRTYRKELESAGLIETVHGAVERRPDGTFRRTITNLYNFLVPARMRREKSSSDRPESILRTNPSPNGEGKTFPRIAVRWTEGCNLDDYGPDDRWYYVEIPNSLAPALV